MSYQSTLAFINQARDLDQCPIPIEVGYYYARFEDKEQGVVYHLQRGYERPKDLADRNPETDF